MSRIRVTLARPVCADPLNESALLLFTEVRYRHDRARFVEPAE
jgi:hypothetical protein